MFKVPMLSDNSSFRFFLKKSAIAKLFFIEI